MGAYKYIQETFQKQHSGEDKELFHGYKQKLVQWRKEGAATRVEHPTNPARAHNLGYKAKQGFLVVRARIRRGGRQKLRPVRGRKPSKQGVTKYKPHKSLQLIAEERVARHYPNMEVLNSYWVGEDGQHKFFEVILVDPQHPAIRSDADVSWVLGQRRRVHRGLTSAGKKHRGL
ncbi:50S ribosomal protein L15e [Candidatus Micrarchaeota archaeon]|nr:50S ribosomal protein L15e [Candidatus Micrarchaeota archaeon]